MKTVYSREGDFLVYGVWQVNILLHFFLPFNYQLPIMVVPVFLGQSFCGKTHLAAAIGNYRIALGGQAMLVEVSALFDYLRQTFSPSSDISFDRRFQEIRAAPLLILDDLKESATASAWAEDKLYSLLNYRYNAQLHTVLTSALSADAFTLSYPNLWNKLLDSSRCEILSINMPPYRRVLKQTRTRQYGNR